MRIFQTAPAVGLVVCVLLLWADRSDAAPADWETAIKQTVAASKAPTIAEARHKDGLVPPTVSERRTNPCGCVGCECGCSEGGPCLCDTDPATGKCRCKAKKAEKAEPYKVGKVFDDQEAAARFKDALVQAPVRWTQGGVVYDVPVFSGGVMYGTPVTDITLLGPPPPDIIGEAVVTTVPMQRFAALAPCVPVPAATYYPTAAAAVVPTYQYQQQSYYYPAQQQTNVQVQRRGLFGLQRSYSYQQNYTPPQTATYGSYRQTGAMICGPNGCTPGN